jgi:hypothetical protein
MEKVLRKEIRGCTKLISFRKFGKAGRWKVAIVVSVGVENLEVRSTVRSEDNDWIQRQAYRWVHTGGVNGRIGSSESHVVRESRMNQVSRSYR